MAELHHCTKSTDHIKQATVHKKHLAYHALIIRGRAGWGFFGLLKPPLLSKMDWQESCNGDMTVLHHCSKYTDHIKQATVHKKHLAYHALLIRGRAGWGMLCPRQPPLHSKVDWQESCNGDMIVLHHCTKSTDNTKQATVHKKHLAISRSHHDHKGEGLAGACFEPQPTPAQHGGFPRVMQC